MFEEVKNVICTSITYSLNTNERGNKHKIAIKINYYDLFVAFKTIHLSTSH